MPNDTQPAADQAAPAANGAAKPKSQLMIVRENIERLAPDFRAALPAHVPAEKFVRTALTAIQLNPDIARCEPKTIYAACLKAATDGLILDGREAALVKFNTKMKIDGVDQWVDAAQYMPMVQGILKKARNSGEISYIAARVVYDRDTFSVVYGDEESLVHKPFLDGDPGHPRLAYMVAKLKDGSIVREIMTKTEIEKVRSKSRSKDKGPWADWPEEMWRKTVIRRGAKYLPTSADRADGADLIDIVGRDDALYEDGEQMPEPQAGEQPQPEAQARKPRAPRQPRQSTGGAGSILNTPPAGQQQAQPTDLVEWTDPETGEVHMISPADKAARDAQAKAQPATPAQTSQAQTAPAATPAAQQGLPLGAQDDGLTIPAALRRAPPAAANEPPPPTADDVI